MIARWQQTLFFIHWLGVAAWLVWQWPQSPVRALAGALVPLAVFVLVMTVEFALMHHANRRDPAPRARLTQVVAAWWAELRVALLVFGWRQPFRHRAVPDWLPPAPTGQRGVVLVHGFMCNRGLWLPWLPLLRERGHAHIAVNLEPPMGSIDDYAHIIDAAVQRVATATGMPPVLLCHSMGGLAARAWLRAHPDAQARVHRVLTLGTPHGGTWLGRFSTAVNGRQMSLAGDWVVALQRSEPQVLAGKFVCWFSSCDNIVFPASTATLAGADNRLVQGVAHVEMALDGGVMRECLEEVGRG